MKKLFNMMIMVVKEIKEFFNMIFVEEIKDFFDRLKKDISEQKTIVDKIAIASYHTRDAFVFLFFVCLFTVFIAMASYIIYVLVTKLPGLALILGIITTIYLFGVHGQKLISEKIRNRKDGQVI